MDNIKEVKKLLLELARYKWDSLDNAHTVNIELEACAIKINALYAPMGFTPKESTFVPKGPEDVKI